MAKLKVDGVPHKIDISDICFGTSVSEKLYITSELDVKNSGLERHLEKASMLTEFNIE